MYRKNTASQFFCFQGVDATTGGIKSGVTWTIRRCIDGTFAAATGTVTEDSTNGWYKMALSQADTNGNDISFNFTGTGAIPQTVNIITTACDPTTATNFGITSLPTTACTTNASLLTSGTGTDQLSVTSGRVDLGKILGTAVSTPATAGVLDVNVKNMNNVAATSITTINANQGTTQAITFDANNFQKVDVQDWLGTVVATPATAGIPDVNVKNINNAAAATPGASGGVQICGSNAASTYASLTCTGSFTISDGLLVSRSTSNSSAFVATGTGTGSGVLATGGAAITTTAGGHGIKAVGGASSTSAGGTAGNGVSVLGGAGSASTNGAAIGAIFAGGGTNTVASAAHGISTTGTSTGSGLDAESGAGATGDGIHAVSNASNGSGITGVHAGSGSDFNATTTPLTLAKTTNITGFNDIAATAIVSSGAITTSGGAVTTVTTVTNQLTAAAIATGVWQDTTSGDFTVASSIGNSLYTGNHAPGAASGLALVGSNMGTTTSPIPTAAAIATAVWQDSTAGDFTTASSIGKSLYNAFTSNTSVFTTASLVNAPTGGSAPTAAAIATAVWTDTTGSDFTTTGSPGKILVAQLGGAFTTTSSSVYSTASLANGPGGSGSDPWATALPGSYTAGQAGYILGNNLNAAITSRMATYTQPTGFLAASFPASVGDATAANQTTINNNVLALPTLSQIWTTALTESYRSHGATGTGAQILYEVLENLTNFSISGTTKTVDKINGSTTAKTYTLDSSTAPTAIHEAS